MLCVAISSPAAASGARLPLGDARKTAYFTNFRRAWKLHGEERFERAITLWESCADLAAGSPIPAYHLACAHARSDDTTRALVWLERAVALGYADADVMAWDDDLALLRSESPEAFEALLRKARAQASPGPAAAWIGVRSCGGRTRSMPWAFGDRVVTALPLRQQARVWRASDGGTLGVLGVTISPHFGVIGPDVAWLRAKGGGLQGYDTQTLERLEPLLAGRLRMGPLGRTIWKDDVLFRLPELEPVVDHVRRVIGWDGQERQAVVDRAGRLALVDLESGEVTRLMDGSVFFSNGYRGARFSSDGERLLLIGRVRRDATPVRILRRPGWTLGRELDLETAWHVSSWRVDPGLDRLLVGDSVGARLFDLSEGRPVWSSPFPRAAERVRPIVAFAPDGQRVLSFNSGPLHGVRVLSADDGRLLHGFEPAEVRWAYFTHAGDHIIAGGVTEATHVFDGRDYRKLYIRYDSGEGQSIRYVESLYFDGDLEAARDAWVELAGESASLEALAPQLLDPKRFRASVTGVEVARARIARERQDRNVMDGVRRHR